MYDALDYSAYRASEVVRIDQELFVESFVRRFAESASMTDRYRIEIYDVNEIPPKVSVQVYSRETGAALAPAGTTEHFHFGVIYRIDAILEKVN